MASALAAPIISAMAERGFHRIEDDIAESSVEDWAATGVAAIEEYLRKQADFLQFLDADDAGQ